MALVLLYSFVLPGAVSCDLSHLASAESALNKVQVQAYILLYEQSNKIMNLLIELPNAG